MLADTPTLSTAYEEGMLDASFGQTVSFASSYQDKLPREVPLWHKLKKGIADPALDSQKAPRRGAGRETRTKRGPAQ